MVVNSPDTYNEETGALIYEAEFEIEDAIGTPHFTDCRFTEAESHGVLVSAGSCPEFDACTMADNRNCGVFVAGAAPGSACCKCSSRECWGDIPEGADPQMRNCVIRNNGTIRSKINIFSRDTLRVDEAGLSFYENARGTYTRSGLTLILTNPNPTLPLPPDQLRNL
jgi:hypothetical protein